jgi:hypothetical protein
MQHCVPLPTEISEFVSVLCFKVTFPDPESFSNSRIEPSVVRLTFGFHFILCCSLLLSGLFMMITEQTEEYNCCLFYCLVFLDVVYWCSNTAHAQHVQPRNTKLPVNQWTYFALSWKQILKCGNWMNGTSVTNMDTRRVTGYIFAFSLFIRIDGDLCMSIKWGGYCMIGTDIWYQSMHMSCNRYRQVFKPSYNTKH